VSLKYLLGPVSADEVWRCWEEARRRGECKAFNPRADLNFTIGPATTWDDVQRRLPEAWQPDAVVLDLAFAPVPPCLWQAPVPLIGLARNWSNRWHLYRHLLPHCDVVLADAPGCERLRAAGIEHVRAANLSGLGPTFLGLDADGPAHDVDVLVAANFLAVGRWRWRRWLGRLAALGRRWRVSFKPNLPTATYRDALRRARVVFNLSDRGECNRHALEAAAAGALLLQEAANVELPRLLKQEVEFVPYTEKDLEERLEHYLAHEDERRAIARAGQARVQAYSFDALWQEALQELKADWPAIEERSQQRCKGTGPGLAARVWQAVCGGRAGGDLTLVRDLTEAVAGEPDAAVLHHALGLARFLDVEAGKSPVRKRVWSTAPDFERALAANPRHAAAAVSLVEVLAGDPARVETAMQAARQVLALLDDAQGPDPASLDAPPLAGRLDLMLPEWERAAREHVGDPAAEARVKIRLLRGHTCSLLARLEPKAPEHVLRAARDCPDFPGVQAALGVRLAHAGRLREAIHCLLRELNANPFDLEAARLLHRMLRVGGHWEASRRFARDRRLLHAAAPGLVPREDWHADDSRPGLPPSAPLRPNLRVISHEEFRRRFGGLDTARALCSWTNPADTNVVLTLLAQARPRRVLEVGTALGHMTANLAEWAPNAAVYSVGTVAEEQPGSGPQAPETPPRAAFGRLAGRFGGGGRIRLVAADSLDFDFTSLGELDFAFIDGAHDLPHVLSDTRNAYRALRPGGFLVWHDVGSTVPWVEVDAALARAGLPEVIEHVAGAGVAFLRKSPEGRLSEKPPLVRWEGPQAGLHSLALVNRELCRRLVARGVDLSLVPREFPAEAGVPEQPLPPELAGRLQRGKGRPAEVHVRHAWPPDFTPPDSGRWVMVQPWEFGSLPKAWVRPLTELVDEVWCYSRAVRECYVQSGLPAERVRLVPLGVDTTRFAPGVSPYPLGTGKRCKLLFVGGTIHRKGFDVLLQGYGQAFSEKDDVCLVVKDMGAKSFYRGQTGEELLARFRERPDAPEVEYLDRDLSQEEMAALYTACNCLVHPYRGEGFALPVAEAMACGLPVIVTGAGAVMDYCSGERAYLLPARVVRLPEKRVGKQETVDFPRLFEPDLPALVETLRHVFEHPDEARAKGQAACDFVRAHLGWEHTAEIVARRLDELRRRPIRRAFSRGTQPLPGRRMRVSLCLIVRNEEANLGDCLKSAADLVDEIVVVDTGSTDGTKEIAASFGEKVKVIDFPWCDDFAAARNESLRHATGEWIFWLDADDRLDEDNRRKLRALFAGLRDEKAAYSFKCLCLPDPMHGAATLVDHVRLFRNDPKVRWRYRVHEQILPAVRATGARVRFADVVVCHTGYQDPAVRRRKLDRDLRLLGKEHAEQPEDPFTLFNLGQVMQELGRHAEALPYLRRSLERSGPRDSIVRKLHALIVGCHRALRQGQEAEAACAEGLRVCPGDTELLFLDSVLRKERGDLAGSEASLLRLLNEKPAAHFASVDAGLRGHKARHNLGVLYFQQGRVSEAEAQWRACVQERPDFLPGWVGLGECCLRLGNFQGLETVAGKAEGLPGGAVDAALLRGRGLTARRDFQAARALLESACATFPQAVPLRSALSHVLLQEGRDLQAAEDALRQVLRLDPENKEARHNLDLLLRQRKGQGTDTAAA
jgi:glycosyltransferase involved in cell wall biosynthesis/Flp pilus assembly protein TadD